MAGHTYLEAWSPDTSLSYDKETLKAFKISVSEIGATDLMLFLELCGEKEPQLKELVSKLFTPDPNDPEAFDGCLSPDEVADLTLRFRTHILNNDTISQHVKHWYTKQINLSGTLYIDWGYFIGEQYHQGAEFRDTGLNAHQIAEVLPKFLLDIFDVLVQFKSGLRMRMVF